MQKCPIQILSRKYLSFHLYEGCGSSLPPCRAHVYFQWYGFQASNHIIKALHHIYSSSKVSDNLQLFSTPTAKPCANMNTLGSILIIWCISSLAWFISMWVKTLILYCTLSDLINRWIKAFFRLQQCSAQWSCMHDNTHQFSIWMFCRHSQTRWKPLTQQDGNGFRTRRRSNH